MNGSIQALLISEKQVIREMPEYDYEYFKKAVYDVMKDDADIIAALAEKTNITLIQNT